MRRSAGIIFVSVYFASLNFDLALGTGCMSLTQNEKCLSRAEVLQLGSVGESMAQYMNDGDTCFTHNRKKRCWIGVFHMDECDTESSADCDSGSSGDGGAVGKASHIDSQCNYQVRNPSCTADISKYCPMNIFLNGVNREHTMCKYCGVDTRKCHRVCDREGISKADQDYIVDRHNELRRFIAKGLETRGAGGGGTRQEPARNMRKLEWDDELAKVAQRWADQCQDAHDKNRVVEGHTSYPFVGQNVVSFWSSRFSKTRDYKALIQRWYDEVQYFPYKNPVVFNFRGVPKRKIIGHYTQLAWAKSYKMGCGFISYFDTTPRVSRSPYRQTMVCNYAPGGNEYSKNVYEVGPTGSDCNSEEDGLCTSVK